MVRRELMDELLEAARQFPVVTVLGPRQSGKTTLIRSAFPKKPYRSLEEPDVRAAAQQDPRGFLAPIAGGVILDEVQRVPELLSYLQGEVDRKRGSGRFILTGSHQPALHQAIAQTLAGRTAILTLLPFSLGELASYGLAQDPFRLIVKGAFPRVYEESLTPERFFKGYVQTYLERDVRSLMALKDLRRFQQFLTLVAGRLGQVVNYTSLGNDTGVSSTTTKDWISVMQASFALFELPPFFENLGKRAIKSPKLYFTDTGLAAFLAGISDATQASRDPLRGALFENWLVLECLKRRLNRGRSADLYFFRDNHGNEVDLVIRKGRTVVPVEIKSAATFTQEFHRGIEGFRRAAGSRALGGAILYGGPDDFVFRGARVFNPLLHQGLDDLLF